MKQATLRTTILLMWALTFVFCVIAIIILPKFRVTISDDQVLNAVKTFTSIWVPVFTCLATFWFGRQETRNRSHKIVLDRDQWLPALGITGFYLVLVTGMLLWVGYGVDYSAPEFRGPNVEFNKSFDGKILLVVQWAGILSAFGTAPAIWLSGGRTTAAQNKNTD